MKALVVYCHPNPNSYTHAVQALVQKTLITEGAETRLIDLYDSGFDPRLSAHDLEIYADTSQNRALIADHCAALEWCDTLIFVYPTWWYGMPAMLKGWLDRVLVPGLAFHMPEDGADIKPALTHINQLAVFTTCGASWWLTRMIGAPGKRTILRGVRLLCAPRCKTTFAAHYLMDSATPKSLKTHLDRVARNVKSMVRRAA